MDGSLPTNGVKKRSNKSSKNVVVTKADVEAVPKDIAPESSLDQPTPSFTSDKNISSFEVPPHLTDYWDFLDAEATTARRARKQEVKSARRLASNGIYGMHFEGLPSVSFIVVSCIIWFCYLRKFLDDQLWGVVFLLGFAFWERKGFFSAIASIFAYLAEVDGEIVRTHLRTLAETRMASPTAPAHPEGGGECWSFFSGPC